MSLGGYADIFLRNTLASGVVPQISAIMGPCAGGAVYSPAITDFILMVEGDELHVRHRAGRDQDGDPRGGDQGGPGRRAHPRGQERRRALHLRQRRRLPDGHPRAALATCRRTTSTSRPRWPPTTIPTARSPALDTLVPEDPNKPYDILQLDRRGGRRRQVPRGARAVREEHRGRLRAAGRTHRSASSPTSRPTSPACSTSTPRSRARASSASATPSTSRSSPSRTSPASCPAPQQEYGGIIKHGAKLLYAYAEATVPKLTVITRKAYGGAYCVMASKHLRTDVNLAYPTAEIAVMGPEGAVNILYRRELAEAGERAAEVRAEKIAEYREKFANPWIAAERGFVDEVIEPRKTRPTLDPRAAPARAASARACRPRSTATFRCSAIAPRPGEARRTAHRAPPPRAAGEPNLRRVSRASAGRFLVPWSNGTPPVRRRKLAPNADGIRRRCARHERKDWTKPAAMAIPKEGYFELEKGRYGPIYPRDAGLPRLHHHREDQARDARTRSAPTARRSRRRSQGSRTRSRCSSSTTCAGSCSTSAATPTSCTRASSTPTSTSTPRTRSRCSRATGINTIFENLEGFPADWKTNAPAFVEFVREHQCPSFLEYGEYPYVTADEIKKALRLKQAFSDMLDQMQ